MLSYDLHLQGAMTDRLASYAGRTVSAHNEHSNDDPRLLMLLLLSLH